MDVRECNGGIKGCLDSAVDVFIIVSEYRKMHVLEGVSECRMYHDVVRKITKYGKRMYQSKCLVSLV